MTILQENDVLFAHKALNITPCLTEAARRVAGAIIDHFNKKTGQCDPSIDRLCKLLGLSRATVIRATQALHAQNFIEKDSHGGKMHRASYRPNWNHFRTIVKDWDQGMKSLSSNIETDNSDMPENKTKVASVRPSESQGCDVNGLIPATQTLRRNPSKKPFEETRAQKPSPNQTNQNKLKVTQRLSKNMGLANQCPMLLPINGGKRISPMVAARQAAQRRWEKDAKKRGDSVYAVVAEWITEERQEAATDAELKNKGAGLRLILESIQDVQCAAG